MVTVTGFLKTATGDPISEPFTIALTDFGVHPPEVLYLPKRTIVTPDVNGYFEIELWANQTSSHPCYYRVEYPTGTSFLISIPGGVVGSLDIGELVVTKADLSEDTNILHRLAKLEASGGGGGGGGATLSTGAGLVGGPYDGSVPVTVAVDGTIARVDSPTFVNPRGNHPPSADSSTRLATTSWAGDASNLSAGVIPLARLPINLAATTATRLATPRNILGVPFDGTADVPPLNLGTGLLSPTVGNLFLDFNVVASAGDPRFTNSREWTATTVTQAEAVAGTDTTRKAWTVQRVWQAIGAWWATIDSTIARLASPTFTGTPSAPTPSALDTSTRIATTAWASNATNLTQGTIPSARVPLLNQDTTGLAGSATKLATARSILGASFDGTADLPITLGEGIIVDTGVLKLDPTDTRLSDAREWTASTVTQTEAETGTATTRRAWTAQRVRQAITAWWATIDGTIARLASPSFTGSPTAPTPGSLDSSTKIATTEFASNASNLTLGTIPSARVPTLNQSTTGNAATATRLATGRAIAITGGATATGVTFDGTANISLAVTALDASLLTGAIADARLSSNVTLKNVVDIRTAGQVTSGSLTPAQLIAANQLSDFTIGNNIYRSWSSLGGAVGFKNLDMEYAPSGYFYIRRPNDAYTAVSSYPLTIDTSNNFTFDGFCIFGSGNVGLKCKKLTGTTASTSGGPVSIPHGLNGGKILHIQVKVVQSANAGVYGKLNSAQYGFSYYHDSTSLYVINDPGNSDNILSKPFTALVWYES